MRQVTIPKAIVEALNGLFDAKPEAIAALLDTSATDVLEPGVDVDPAKTVNVLDVVNTILDAVAPGKRIATIHGPDGLEGFVIGRDRKSAPEPEANAE